MRDPSAVEKNLVGACFLIITKTQIMRCSELRVEGGYRFALRSDAYRGAVSLILNSGPIKTLTG